SASFNGSGVPTNDICTPPIQGLCPPGWHVPSHYEWTTLERHLGSNPSAFPYDQTTTGWLGTNEGGNIKVTSICGTLPCWNSPNTGATNSSEFSSIPAGYVLSGSFSNAGVGSFYWTSTESSSTSGWRHS